MSSSDWQDQLAKFKQKNKATTTLGNSAFDKLKALKTTSSTETSSSTPKKKQKFLTANPVAKAATPNPQAIDKQISQQLQQTSPIPPNVNLTEDEEYLAIKYGEVAYQDEIAQHDDAETFARKKLQGSSSKVATSSLNTTPTSSTNSSASSAKSKKPLKVNGLDGLAALKAHIVPTETTSPNPKSKRSVGYGYKGSKGGNTEASQIDHADLVGSEDFGEKHSVDKVNPYDSHLESLNLDLAQASQSKDKGYKFGAKKLAKTNPKAMSSGTQLTSLASVSPNADDPNSDPATTDLRSTGAWGDIASLKLGKSALGLANSQNYAHLAAQAPAVINLEQLQTPASSTPAKANASASAEASPSTQSADPNSDQKPHLATDTDDKLALLAAQLQQKFGKAPKNGKDLASTKASTTTDSDQSDHHDQEQADFISQKLASWLYHEPDQYENKVVGFDFFEEGISDEDLNLVNPQAKAPVQSKTSSQVQTSNGDTTAKATSVDYVDSTNLPRPSRDFSACQNDILDLLDEDVITNNDLVRLTKQLLRTRSLVTANSKVLSKAELAQFKPASVRVQANLKPNQAKSKARPLGVLELVSFWEAMGVSELSQLVGIGSKLNVTELWETAIINEQVQIISAQPLVRKGSDQAKANTNPNTNTNTNANPTNAKASKPTASANQQAEDWYGFMLLNDADFNADADDNASNSVPAHKYLVLAQNLVHELISFTTNLVKAVLHNQQRLAQIPANITYNNDLPVSQSIDQIRSLLLHNQVVIIAGDTGSGKTTQIPKLCLELGLSDTGLIGHTQPRRIAASSVAKRISTELGVSLGQLVGYKVRFTDQVSPNTHIKLMTDGILLAEIQSDPLLQQYSCLIIDEAHERSLNNEFILGYLKVILPLRPDLKIIVTSATINLERFSQHFNNCPIIQVEGRTFPVEVRYRPLSLTNFNSDREDFNNWEEQMTFDPESGVTTQVYSAGEISNSLADKLEGKLEHKPETKFKLPSSDLAKSTANTDTDLARTDSNNNNNSNSSNSSNSSDSTASSSSVPASGTNSSSTSATTKSTIKPAKETKDKADKLSHASMHDRSNVDKTFGLSTVNPYANTDDEDDDLVYAHLSRAQVLALKQQQREQEQLKAQALSSAPTESAQTSIEPVQATTSLTTNLTDSATLNYNLDPDDASRIDNYHLLDASDLTTLATDNYAQNYQQQQASANDDQPKAGNGGKYGFGTSAADFQAYRKYKMFAEDDNGLELSQGVIAASEELLNEGLGDILVFLSGEREIHDVASELTSHFTHINKRYPHLKILPLYSRLSSSDQELIFKPDGSLRIILATNIAETSLTVPGIKYVIDAGTARISRYSYKTHVQGLPIEPIAQASANQRKGRCGRTCPGICIRLYSEDDFLSRPVYTDPEIKRTNLSAIILKMLSLGLPDIMNFPFLDAPDASFIRNGIKVLLLLQAIAPHPQQANSYVITNVGRQLSTLPVDPRLARMIFKAKNKALNEMLIIAAGMTVVDIRERPTGKQQQAQQSHAEFKDDRSDYMTLLNIWNYLQEQKLSNNQLRKLCKKRYLNYLRFREWQDLYQQLKLACISLKYRFNQLPASYSDIHSAIISGFLDHLAQLSTNDNGSKQQLLYKGAHNRTFRFFPTSALYKKRYPWVISSEVIHLANTYALRGASIETKWVEANSEHLLKHTYHSPAWSKKRGEVTALKNSSLFGLTIVENQRVSYTKIAPEICRQIFIRSALVEQNWDAPYEFFEHNNKVIAKALAFEEEQRQAGILIHEQDLFDWYNQRIPEFVNSNVTFAKWWKQQSKKDPHLLDLNFDQIIEQVADQTVSYPKMIKDGDYEFNLLYIFNPKLEDDGVNVLIPIQNLVKTDYRLYQWHIDQYREELVTEMIRHLPKKQRKQLIPANDYAHAFVERVPQVMLDKTGKAISIYQVLSHFFKDLTGTYIEPNEWQAAHQELPAHLHMHFRVLDLQHQVLGSSDNLQELQLDLSPKAQQLVNKNFTNNLKSGQIYTDWEFGRIGQMTKFTQNNVVLEGYPTLVPVLSLAPEQKALILKSKFAKTNQQKLRAKQKEQLHTSVDTDMETVLTTAPSSNAISMLTDKPNNKASKQSGLGNNNYLNQIASGVILQNFSSRQEQERIMHQGIRDLLLLNSLNPIKYLQENLPNRTKLAMYFAGNVQLIVGECICCAADHIITEYQEQAQAYSLQKGNKLDEQGRFIWDKNYYEFLLNKIHESLNDHTYKVASTVEQILVLAHQINKELRQNKVLALMLAVNDLKQQLLTLTRQNFVATHTLEQLMQVPKYLNGMLYRMERMGNNPDLDHQRQQQVNDLEVQYQDLEQNWPVYRDPNLLQELFFMLQELRISLFAQSLGTKYPVSAKRVQSYIDQIREGGL